jgi:hypothetical protein
MQQTLPNHFIFIGDADSPQALVDALLIAEAAREEEAALAEVDPELAAFAAQWDAAAEAGRAQAILRSTEAGDITCQVWAIVSAAPYLSTRAIAAQLQISNSTVHVALGKLEAAGYIAIARDTRMGRAAPRTRTVLCPHPSAAA